MLPFSSVLQALVIQSIIQLSERTMKFWRSLTNVVWFTIIFDSASSLAVDESRFLDWQVAISHVQGDTSGCSPGYVDIIRIWKSTYKNSTYVVMSTKPMEQPDWSPCT